MHGSSLNPRRRGDKWLTMVVIFVGCLVLGDDPNVVLFLPYKTYGAGVFRSRPNPCRCKAVNFFKLLTWTWVMSHLLFAL